MTDDRIQENKSFSYAIFTPSGRKKNNEAIILLHGLNERTWEKYLTWAEYLTHTTGKPVILFPIAFHMNRTPGLWANPRAITPLGKQTQGGGSGTDELHLRQRSPQQPAIPNPLRFYASGRESVYNMWQLVHEIKNGEHPLFKEDTSINLFAYSIGALLSQVLLLANPDKMFTDTRLFMFCGGSIFSEMDGNARDIMDKEAFAKVRHYFRHDFLENRTLPTSFKNDFLEQAFKAMVREDVLRDYRESFFQRACDRIRAISLKKDIVMPTGGVIKALGKASGKILEELDFPFAYSPSNPFPTHSRIDPGLINQAFHSIFTRAAAFL